MKNISRRRFVRSSSILAAGLLFDTKEHVGIASGLLRLGGPVFLKTDDPVELAKEHRKLGYSAAYVPVVRLQETDKISAIRKAFTEQNVVIAEVGAWVNMLEKDDTKRKKNIDYVIERLALAEEIGAINCVNIAGSFSETQWDGPHPNNLTQAYFDATVENCRKVIDAVKPRKAKFSLEMMGWSLPDNPDSYLKFIKAIDRPAFGAHVDIANILSSPQKFYDNRAIINETFRKLGRWVTSCHAKDLIGKDVHLAETIPGKGGIDYEVYIRNVVSLPHEIPLMLEHLRTPDEYDDARNYVLAKAKMLGIKSA